jgi:replication-associated recombination protein RarA
MTDLAQDHFHLGMVVLISDRAQGPYEVAYRRTVGTTDRLADLEHAADNAERAVTTVVLQGDGDVRTALPVLELARALERATDRLSAMGHLLHHHVMAGLSG